MNKWLRAELDYWQSQKTQSLATLELYFNNSVGIGEHSDLIEEFDKQLDKLASAQEKLQALEGLLP